MNKFALFVMFIHSISLTMDSGNVGQTSIRCPSKNYYIDYITRVYDRYFVHQNKSINDALKHLHTSCVKQIKAEVQVL
jgi:hypothetical protein